VPVEAAAGAVVAHGGPGIGTRGSFLDIAERDPGVEGGGDERVPQVSGLPSRSAATRALTPDLVRSLSVIRRLAQRAALSPTRRG
jgi:hypothetical protein